MRKSLGILAVCAALLTGGCLFYAHPVHRHGPPAHVGVFHVHGPACGHYWLDGVWISLPVGHLHGGGCGHHLSGGVWFGTKFKVKARR